eukprot:1161956-Pelagomonas_calceolata.AAC.28
MLYADDLCLTTGSNQPDQLQLMLHGLHACAQRKGMVINTAKSEVVHLMVTMVTMGGDLQPGGDNVPVFMLGGVWLVQIP